MRTISILLLTLAMSGAALAQRRADVAVTYVPERANVVGGCGCFWLQGAGAEVGMDLWHGFGAAANMTGVHAGSMGPQKASLGLFTVTFGPRYRYPLPKIGGHESSLTGKALFGVGHAFDSVFPGVTGATPSSTSFASEIGGQFDVHLTRRFDLRIVEADWAFSRFPNTNSNQVQNSLRLGFGAVVHFGKK